MKITEELLEQLGATKRTGWLYINSNGYSMRFQKSPNSEAWKFSSYIDSNKSSIVTDLEECFGIVAEDHFEQGKLDKACEIKQALGL